MIIAIDAMGGDNAPGAVIDGVSQVLPRLHVATELVLYGNEEVLIPLLAEYKVPQEKVTIVHTTEVIGGDEQPTSAIRSKKDSSLVRALIGVSKGEADGIVSAGNSGALLAGATLIVKRISGVKRPAFAPILPTRAGGSVLLLDSGANTDCKPQYLRQFAVMGAAYMSRVMGIRTPRVGLLNNGTESDKGNELTKAAYPLLAETEGVNFTGNCEAREALSGDFDVIVCDGFDGNVLLKSIEGTASALFDMLKKELYASFITKLGAALAKPAFRSLKRRMDYTEHGGAPLLGIKAGVIKAHGSSNGRAFCNAILQAQRFLQADVGQIIAESVAALPDED